MRLAVTCPVCKRPMATSAAFTGQMIACPNCRNEFVLNPPGTTPPATATPTRATSDMFPPTFRGPRTEHSPAIAMPPPAAPAEEAEELKLSPIAPPTPTPLPPSPPALPSALPQPGNVARFKTAASAAPAIAPSADGKLPELMLADGEMAGTAADGGERPVPLWLAVIAVAGSTVLSVFLLLGDAPAQKSAQSRRAEVRQEISSFYGTEAINLRPFQVLLREAQQAHSRGDRATERQKYRQVLALLRSEKRSKYENVTGTPGDDERLAELLSILLTSE
jgi:hypothetical protein